MREKIPNNNFWNDIFNAQDKPCLRAPETFNRQRLGAFHASFLSFSRSLIRTMIQKKWCIRQTKFQFDDDGIGTAIYQIRTASECYSVIFFTAKLANDKRTDRVIAEQWDLCCALCFGALNKNDIQTLSENLPKQEKGRYSSKVISISRANKSLRLFEYIVQCLAEGKQPSLEEMSKTGYLVRTTAVYGNGKFGMADYGLLEDTDLEDCYRAQMLIVYLVRLFTIDWVECLAKNRNPKKFMPLDKAFRKYIGTGNSTGLGMAPFLIKHPLMIHQWIKQREQALYEIVNLSSADEKHIKECKRLIKKASLYFKKLRLPEPIQQKKNSQLSRDLKKLSNLFNGRPPTSWENYLSMLREENYGYDTEELFLNILLEIYPDISQKYDSFKNVPFDLKIKPGVTVQTLLFLIEKYYPWAIKIDFTDPKNKLYFWYSSEDKSEPRLGNRLKEEGKEKEMKINIAEQVKNLYMALKNLDAEKKQCSVGNFLLANPEFSGITRRVINAEIFEYGEIRDNILSENFYPIDLLKFKLAMFGAVKFDPKSDRWLRITLFQGAPLTKENGNLDSQDDWFLYDYK